MKARRGLTRPGRLGAAVRGIVPTVLILVFACVAGARVRSRAAQAPRTPTARAEAELQTGITLTRQGRFAAAIPHFVAARGHVADEFAADFNLALCYVAIGSFQRAIPLLDALRNGGQQRAQVDNLLAQARIGTGQPEAALAFVEEAARLNPQDEKLYLFIADACLEQRQTALGLKVVDLGLSHLPRSPRLHYERGVFLSFVNQPDLARQEMARAQALAPGTTIGALAAAQSALLNGDPKAAAEAARQGLQQAPENYILLTLLGKALLENGAAPGQPDYQAAQTALEKAVGLRPNYAPAQLALGRLELLAGHASAAIAHLEAAQRQNPDDPAAYSFLAAAYRRSGDRDKAAAARARMAALNREQTERYKSAAPASYVGGVPH